MKEKDNTYEIIDDRFVSEYFHYRCVDCGFEDDVMDVACGADHEGGPFDLDCYECGGTFKYMPNKINTEKAQKRDRLRTE